MQYGRTKKTVTSGGVFAMLFFFAAFAFLLTVFPAGFFNIQQAPEVRAADRTINSLDDLTKFRDDVNNNANGATAIGYTVELTTNINLGLVSNWVPIGNTATATRTFRGTFDGGNHTISGLAITTATGGYQGLFGYIMDGNFKVQNLSITGANIDLSAYATGTYTHVGILAGGTYSTTSYGGVVINNVNVSGTVKSPTGGTRQYYGGIVGNLRAAAGAVSAITNCTSNVTINANNYIGGMVGYSTYTNFSGCQSSSIITAGGNYAGGIAGYVGGSIIENCNNYGDITGMGNSIGGIVGYSSGSLTDYAQRLVIRNCSSGTPAVPVIINGSSSLGGIIGYATRNSAAGTAYFNEVEDCYANIFSDSGSIIGGIAGNVSCTNISRCQSEGVILGATNDAGGIAGGVEGSTVDNHAKITDCHSTVSVTVLDGYSAGGIAGFSSGVDINNCTYSGTLISMLFLGGIAGLCIDSVITNCITYGNYTATFMVGGISGSNGIISNCTNYASLFATTIAGGICAAISAAGSSIDSCNNYGTVYSEIDDLSFLDPSLAGTLTGSGGIIGVGWSIGLFGGLFGDAGADFFRITNSNNYGTVSGGCGNLGGIMGSADCGAIIENCRNSGDVLGNLNNIGGIVGYSMNPLSDAASRLILRGCSSYGKIGGGNYKGGIIGYASGTAANAANTQYYSIIEDCYADANFVSGASNGGIAGVLEYANISRCAAKTMSTGSIGCCGFAYQLLNSIVKDCYVNYDVSTSASATESYPFAYSVLYSGVYNCFAISNTLNTNINSQFSGDANFTPAAPFNSSKFVNNFTFAKTARYGFFTTLTSHANFTGSPNAHFNYNYYYNNPTNYSQPFNGTNALMVSPRLNGYGDSGINNFKSQSFLTSSANWDLTNGYAWDFADIWVIVPTLNDGYPTLRSLISSQDLPNLIEISVHSLVNTIGCNVTAWSIFGEPANLNGTAFAPLGAEITVTVAPVAGRTWNGWYDASGQVAATTTFIFFLGEEKYTAYARASTMRTIPISSTTYSGATSIPGKVTDPRSNIVCSILIIEELTGDIVYSRKYADNGSGFSDSTGLSLDPLLTYRLEIHMPTYFRPAIYLDTAFSGTAVAKVFQVNFIPGEDSNTRRITHIRISFDSSGGTAENANDYGWLRDVFCA